MEPRVVRETFVDADGNEVPPADPRAVEVEIVSVEDGTETRTYAALTPEDE